MKLVGLGTLVTWVILLPVTASAQLTPLVADVDVLDGIYQDLAGPDDATDYAITDHRVFKTQGRRMGAFDITDGITGIPNYERMYLEEPDEGLFDSTVIAVEVDSQRGLRFALTAVQEQASPPILAVVKIDDIFDPSFPQNLSTLTIDNAAIPSTMTMYGETEDTVNLRVYPSQSRLLVIREHDILIVDYTAPSAPVIESAAELPGGLASPAGNKFVELASAEIFEINGKRLAFMETVIDRVTLDKPRPRGLTVCNLDSFAAPTFYNNTFKHLYDPLPDPVQSPDEPFQFGIHALDVVQDQVDPTKHYMYLATFKGSLVVPHVFPFHQVRKVDVSNVPQDGFIDVAGMDITETGDPIPLDPLVWLIADPDAGSGTDHLYAMGHAKAYAVRLDFSDYAWTRATFGFDGPRRDAHFLLEHDANHPGKETRRRIWSDGSKVVDYRWRIQDVTSVFAPPPNEGPEIVHEGYAQGGADGAVAVFGAPWGDSVYLSTWGGVVRYDVDLASGTAAPDYASYQPAADTGSVFGAHSTEEIAIGLSGNSDYHVVVQAGNGGFYEWKLGTSPSDPDEYGNPQPNLGYVASDKWPMTWVADPTLGVDIELGRSPGGDDIVVIDLGNQDQDKLAVDCYDMSTDFWHPSIILLDVKPLAGDLAVDGNWLFVGGREAFGVVDLTTWTQVDSVYVNDSSVCAESYARVEGIARYEDRLFVSMSGGSGASSGVVAMYEFDEATGAVGNAIDCVCGTDFSVSPGAQDGGKCYTFPLDSQPPLEKVRVYAGTQNGYLLEMEYTKDSTPATPVETFDAIAYWHNGGYFEYFTDNRVYDLDPGPGVDPRVVVGRFTETFAVVRPLGY